MFRKGEEESVAAYKHIICEIPKPPYVFRPHNRKEEKTSMARIYESKNHLRYLSG